MINSLLIPNASARLTMSKAKQHEWFSGIDIDAADKRGLIPPFIPDLSRVGDHTNFIDWPNLKFDDTKPPIDSSYTKVPIDLLD